MGWGDAGEGEGDGEIGGWVGGWEGGKERGKFGRMDGSKRGGWNDEA